MAGIDGAGALLVLGFMAALLVAASQVEGLCSEVVGGVRLPFRACLSIDAYSLSWNLTNGTVLTGLFTTRHDGWIAFGMSPQGMMVGSNVLVGSKDTTMESKATVTCYHLGSKDDAGVKPPCEKEFPVYQSNAFYNGSHLALLFQVGLDVRARSNDGTVSMVYAKGVSAGRSMVLEQHDRGAGKGVQFDFSGGGPPRAIKSPTHNLRKTHGIIQFVAFAVLIPVGATLPSVFRAYDPCWFYAHATFQSTGLVLGSTGFFLGLSLRKQHHGKVKDRKVDAHYYIGIIVFTLCILQVLALVVRPKKEATWRAWWNVYHRSVGGILIVIAFVNCSIGCMVYGLQDSYFLAYSVGLAVFSVALRVLQCWMQPGSRDDSVASTITVPSLSRTHSTGRGPMTSESTGRFERL